MSTILVSVIIPVYNVEPYLREALDSVINQTYENLEILIVDDGSTDDSGMICDEYAHRDSRIRVIHQNNKGLSAARNAGLDAMNGELVVFLDSDDAYQPEFVSILVDAQIQENTDIVVCRFSLHKETNKLLLNNKTIIGPTIGHGSISRIEALKALISNEINVSVWNKIYKRELWNDIRFPEGHVYEDIATTHLVMNLSNKITIIDSVLYMHRQRSGSITQTNSWDNLSDRLLACSHFDEFVEINTPTLFSTNDLKRKLQTTLNSNMTLYVRYKNKKDALAVELRDRLIRRGREIGLDKLSYLSRIAFFMFCHCPMILSIAYPIYVPFKRLAYKIAGK